MNKSILLKQVCLFWICLLLGMLGISQQPLKLRDTTIRGPQTFAMIVGVSKYKYVRPLTYADKDAELFRDYLRSPGGGSVKLDNIFCLLNEQAINSNFWGKGFQWLKAKNLKRGDKLFIYLAGHGDAIDEDQFFFLGYDCNPNGDKNNYLVSGAIQLFNLKKKIANETSKGVEVIFVMDACRSNELPGGTEGQNFLNTAVSEKQAGEIIMLATGAGQASLEDASIGNGHGLFTYYLVEGLNGLADSLNRDQKISFREIQTYVGKYVPSIAQQRFNRKQDPFFCCTESSERIISSVDTNYLKNWLKTNRGRRGPGNSYDPYYNIPVYVEDADTLLVQTYDRFNSAVRRNNLSGPSSAEDFYRQLAIKYPNNPYTLDAQSTLAVEFINVGQKLIDDYLSCGEPSERKKQQMGEAGAGMEKAITLIRDYDVDFANSLLGRMYFLKASGINLSNLDALRHAYGALNVNPDGAYIMNKLALLHLENKRTDSALHYATKATTIAPNWACALTTLALVRQAMSNTQTEPKQKTKAPKIRNSPGFTLGGGINQSKPEFRDNPNTNVVAVESNNTPILDLGILYHVNLGNNFSIRPTAIVLLGTTEVTYTRRPSTGGPLFTEIIPIKSTIINFSVPLIIRFNGNRTRPYIMLAPSGSYSLGQDVESASRLPLKDFNILGDAGVGVDFKLVSGVVISPELKYTAGLTDMKDPAGNTIYTNSVSAFKKQVFSLNIYLRRR